MNFSSLLFWKHILLPCFHLVVFPFSILWHIYYRRDYFAQASYHASKIIENITTHVIWEVIGNRYAIDHTDHRIFDWLNCACRSAYRVFSPLFSFVLFTYHDGLKNREWYAQSMSFIFENVKQNQQTKQYT